jgi:hypothetical protein
MERDCIALTLVANGCWIGEGFLDLKWDCSFVGERCGGWLLLWNELTGSLSKIAGKKNKNIV